MTKTLGVIAAARRRDPVLELEAYCEAGDCPARVTTVRVKDYDEELLPLLRARRGLRCPICGGPLKLHHAITIDEAAAQRRAAARASVAVEMYARDHDTLAVPMAVYLDDRLPPTPPGWWDGMSQTTDEVKP